MRKSNNHLFLVIVVVFFLCVIASCHKSEKTAAQEPDTEQSTATDNHLIEEYSNDIFSIGSQVCETASLSTYKTNENTIVANFLLIAPCATISGVSTKTITVDFGITGCIGTDGKTRKGKLIFDFSSSTPTTSIKFRNPGFSVTVKSINYIVDGNQVSIINKTIKNITPSNISLGTNLTWSITANMSITKTNSGGTFVWNCNRTKELINTSDPLCYNGQANAINWIKAKIKMNGNSSGTNAKGESYTATIKDIIRDFTCAPDPTKIHRHPFISGIIEYTPSNRPTRYINYGNSNCDFNATITINGRSWAITLP